MVTGKQRGRKRSTISFKDMSSYDWKLSDCVLFSRCSFTPQQSRGLGTKIPPEEHLQGAHSNHGIRQELTPDVCCCLSFSLAFQVYFEQKENGGFVYVLSL